MDVAAINRVGVVGGGVMGSGIAMCFAEAGYRVIVTDTSDDKVAALRHAMHHGAYGWDRAIKRGIFTPEEVSTFAEGVTFSSSPESLEDVDLVVEAIPEDEELKKKVFARLDETVQPNAIFVSNTSGFAITNLCQAVKRRDRFLGMHWFKPANLTALVELVYTSATSEEALSTMEAVAQRLGKTSIRVKDAPGSYGFVANRIHYALMAEAQRIVDAGIASTADIDTAMKLAYGWPTGPFERHTHHAPDWD